MNQTREEEVEIIRRAAESVRKAIRDNVAPERLARVRASTDGVVSLCREAGLNDGQAAALAVFISVGRDDTSDMVDRVVNAVMGKPAPPAPQTVAALVFECFAEGAPDAEG